MSTTPSTTPPPPRTPLELRPDPTPSATPSKSDDSVDDLSFDYEFDDEGQFVRRSKGGNRYSMGSTSAQSTPPTPQDSLPDSSPEPSEPPKSSSPAPRGSSLSRSESAYAVLTTAQPIPAPATETKPLRPFQRVISGPATAGTPSYLAPTIASSRGARIMPRRITMEDHRDRPEALPIGRFRQTLDSSSTHASAFQDEKENIGELEEKPPTTVTTRRASPTLASRATTSRMSSSRTSYSASNNGRPLADVPVPQRAPTARQLLSGPNRPGRVMKSSSSLKYSASNNDRLGEVTELGEAEPAHRENELLVRAASEEAEQQDDPVEPANIPLPNSGSLTNGMRNRRDLNINVHPANSLLSHSGSTRPRRSASLSDALQHDDYQLQVAQPQQSGSRPGTSLGLNDNGVGARRIAPEERERQDMEYKRYFEHIEHEVQPQRQSPSPTNGNPLQRTAQAHRRRDSDTLRGLAPPTSATNPGSPTVMEMPSRPSPTTTTRPGQGRASPSTSLRGRISPPNLKGRASPSALPKGRLSPPTGSRLGSSREAAKHRRSPTAPEPVTNSRSANSQKDEDYALSSSEKDRERERRERERERERRDRREPQEQRPSRELQPYDHLQAAAPRLAPQGSAPQINGSQSNGAQANGPQSVPTGLRHMVVNKKAYARLDVIGKGGSSRVFRVLNHQNELYAIKRVSLDKTDNETMSGYMNEIALLKRLEGNSRIIRLIDSEVKAGPGGSKGHLLLVMECGEVDLARLLQEQMKEPLNMVWVSYYWQQMLQAVHVIHEEKIVHSDLKPANFVLVRGQLKLIDFGIANAIANDTTNIQRDHQIGTVNYMSPEAIELPDGMRRLKVGRPSDVWSLGIILYQMIYGHPPFQHLSVYHKMKAIPDLTHVIQFPQFATPTVPAKPDPSGGPPEPARRLEHLKVRVPPAVIEGMKSCLCRNPKERATIPELLDQAWLTGKPEPVEQPRQPTVLELLGPKETFINPYYMRQLLSYGIKMGLQGNHDPEFLERESERLVGELKTVQTGGAPGAVPDDHP
ncbi:hypothetical protein MD484_g1212, partial [Candolleomyces efflorescens]